MSSKSTFRIADVRAYTSVSGREGGDYHARPVKHWIVEIEAASGEIGIGIGHGGAIGDFIVQQHLWSGVIVATTMYETLGAPRINLSGSVGSNKKMEIQK